VADRVIGAESKVPRLGRAVRAPRGLQVFRQQIARRKGWPSTIQDRLFPDTSKFWIFDSANRKYALDANEWCRLRLNHWL
jgi:hypothetical protein